ncbi:hypothetical protein B296_00025227 [Ensete ventricosum]|uniref:Uncharacterized protein n=1 Tax=Ensete ventricosum TaxID=4639 RepID=A0A426YXG5_ENSVE|nr:hypothetical protein B296_00025227 [Ensete ventricosum]
MTGRWATRRAINIADGVGEDAIMCCWQKKKRKEEVKLVVGATLGTRRWGKLPGNYDVFKREIGRGEEDTAGWKGLRVAARKATTVAACGRGSSRGGRRRGSRRGGLLLQELLVRMGEEGDERSVGCVSQRRAHTTLSLVAGVLKQGMRRGGRRAFGDRPYSGRRS